jgi:D-aspartate ligase
VTAPEAQSIIEPLTKAFFDAIRSIGMCSMEFKHDRLINKFLMIEPTVGRTNWQEEVASLDGSTFRSPPIATSWSCRCPPPKRLVIR